MFIYNLLKNIKNKCVEFYSFNFYNYEKNIKVFYDFYSDSELVDEIVYNKKSISRFGDGEFKLIYKKSIGFQKVDDNLASDLKEVLLSNNENLIVCIPKAINCISYYTKETQNFYKYYYFKFRKKLEKLIPRNKKYGDALITRFYMDYEDKSKSIYRINNLKRIWNNKCILIVEGYNSKLGIGNDLFDNCNNIRRIIVPNTNAYEKKDIIIQCIKENVHEDEIVILAVGPTATVLSYYLSNIGIQSIDLGHVDLEYEWFNRGVTKKVDIDGKNVNEINKNINDGSIDNDEIYINSIIRKI